LYQGGALSCVRVLKLYTILAIVFITIFTRHMLQTL